MIPMTMRRTVELLSGLISNDGDNNDAAAKDASMQPQLKLQSLPKKQKLDKCVADIANSTSLFPPPPLSNDSLITSDVDYFTPKYGIPLASNGKLPLKLLELSSSSTIWAEKLKSQHEFHNPAFFQTAVQKFGIQNALGSTMTCLETMHEYEFDLIQLEEEARIRQHQQWQQQQQQDGHPPNIAPTPYAQEQLERAMQKHLRR
jgi:hypothetical protein